MVWACALAAWMALATGDSRLSWLAVEFIGLGVIAHRGNLRWQQILSVEHLHEERLQEELNTLGDGLRRLQAIGSGSEERLRRYQQLREIANTFGASLTLEELTRRVVRAAAEVVQAGDLVLLYLVDPVSFSLELKSVWRKEGSLTVKAKTGDPIDLWVMRQGQPLLLQDPKTDFRFSQVLPQEMDRPIGSLVVVPLVSEYRFLGVLRVESLEPQGFGGDDLRLVKIVGDLASLGIANSLLYSRTLELAMTDDLTGLFVRGYFEKRLAEEMIRAQNSSREFSLLLIDIDRLKVYNDTFGHSAGDKLLKQMAKGLLGMQQPGEVVSRFGGEEFILLLPGVGPEEAGRRAENIRVSVERSPVELRRTFTHSSVSIGSATFPQDGTAADVLLKVADERLYRAKAMGRNRVCLL